MADPFHYHNSSFWADWFKETMDQSLSVMEDVSLVDLHVAGIRGISFMSCATQSRLLITAVKVWHLWHLGIIILSDDNLASRKMGLVVESCLCAHD